MAFDYNKLKGRIIEICGSQANFAVAMGISERTLISKMKNRIPWKQPEILKAIEVLKLTENDIQEYFFKIEVQNI